MKDDPYSQLTGLDQRLFQEQNSPHENATTKQRDNETTLPSDNARSNETTSEPSKQRDDEVTKPRDSTPAKPRPAVTSHQRSVEATRTRASSPTGHHVRPRIDERHSHDIFHDQVRWMNRLKLEIEETYGARITSNGMVRLAIDLLIEDHKDRGDASALMRVLVRGEPLASIAEKEQGD